MWNINPSPRTLHLFLKRAPGFWSIKYHFCFRFFANWTNEQRYKTSLYDMGWWFVGSVGIEQFWWRILDKNNIHCFHLCMISRNQDEAWPQYVPCVTNLQAIYAWVIRWHVTGMSSLAEHWHGWRALSNHVCAHSVIAMWHVIFCSTLRELAVSNLGQVLFCWSITWPRCRNVYRDLQ